MKFWVKLLHYWIYSILFSIELCANVITFSGVITLSGNYYIISCYKECSRATNVAELGINVTCTQVQKGCHAAF